jgi:hypothetical protein
MLLMQEEQGEDVAVRIRREPRNILTALYLSFVCGLRGEGLTREIHCFFFFLKRLLLKRREEKE